MAHLRKKYRAAFGGFLCTFGRNGSIRGNRKAVAGRRAKLRCYWRGGCFGRVDVLRLLGLEPLEPRHLLTGVSAVSPAANSFDAPLDAEFAVTLDGRVDSTSVTADTFSVHAGQSGGVSVSQPTVVEAGETDSISTRAMASFHAGELVQVTARELRDAAGEVIEPYVWQFTAGVRGGSGSFVDSGQSIGNARARTVALGDVDGDGDVDAFIGNYGQPDRVWLNDGMGRFTDSGQELGQSYTGAVALGDLDGDGDLDAVIGSDLRRPTRVWFNDGAGRFVDSGLDLGDDEAPGVALGDLDGDGDLDVFLASRNPAEAVWLNDGEGGFAVSGQSFEDNDSERRAVALGDIDADGDLDAFVNNRLWLNDGRAGFTDSGQMLAEGHTRTLQLGDLDNDGDLDAFLVTSNEISTWTNDGEGSFARQQRFFEIGSVTSVALGDVDADGDLDAVIAARKDSSAPTFNNGVLFNDGNGQFTLSAHLVARGNSQAVAVADLNDDGDLDVFVTTHPLSEGDGNWVLFNVDAELAVQISPVTFSLPEGTSGPVTYDVTVTNLGPRAVSGASVRDTFASSLSDVSLASVLAAGGAATSATPGELATEFIDAVDLPAGASITYTLQGTLTLAEGQTTPVHEAQVVAPGGVVEANLSNNLAVGRHDAQRTIDRGSGMFVDSGQRLGQGRFIDAALGDFDGDGDVDAFVAAENLPNRVWLNDGLSGFVDSGQALGHEQSQAAAVGDVDGDGDLDAFVANGTDGNTLWLNDGTGHFAASGEFFGRQLSRDVVLGDFDADGDLDAAYVGTGPLQVWRNDGFGRFARQEQPPADLNAFAVAAGDLDGDGDLDLLIANYKQSSTVWRNDGSGLFARSDSLAVERAWDVELGDLDGDGDLDAYFTARYGRSVAYFNEGAEGFRAGTQDFEISYTEGVDLGDVDADGDLDVVLAGFNVPDSVLINDGMGEFTQLSWDSRYSASRAVALADLDGDGDLDAFVVKSTDHVPGNRVWLNAEADLSVDLRPDPEAAAVHPGDVVSYEIIVRNLGPADITGAELHVAGLGPFSMRELVSVAVEEGATTSLVAGPLPVSLSDIVDLPAGSSITLVLNVQVADDSLSIISSESYASVSAQIELPARHVDAAADNNRAIDGHVVALAPGSGTGVLVDSGQMLGNGATYAVALADLDGDGDLDAVFGDDRRQNNLGEVRVWWNEDGTFVDSGQVLARFPTGEIATGDVDGDGDVDVLVGNSSYSDVGSRLFLNDGTGRLADSGIRFQDKGVRIAGLADLDGDGDLDAVLGKSVLLNQGSQGFVAIDGQSVQAGRPSFGDVDGDGDFDILAGASTYLNQGLGTFIGGQVIRSYNMAQTRLADLDGDGDLDVFGAVGSGDGHVVWFGDGQGSFTDSGQRLGDNGALRVALADMDGDGDLDAVTIGFENAAIPHDHHIWINDGVGNFSDGGQLPRLDRIGAFALGDLDGDGDVDAVLGVEDGPNRVWTNPSGPQLADLAVTKNNGISSATQGSEIAYEITVTNQGPAAVSGASLRDVLPRELTDVRMVSVMRSEGAASSIAPGPVERIWTDMLDLPVGGSITYTVAGLLQSGGGAHALADGTITATVEVTPPEGLIDPDLANNVAHDADSVILAATGGSGFLQDSGQMLSDRRGFDVELADLDGDGDLDAFVANYRGDSQVWLNDGTGTFSDSGQNLFGGETIAVDLGDVDLDGDVDAVVLNDTTGEVVWLNDGLGQFTQGQLFNVSTSNHSQHDLLDIDGDGDLDLVSGRHVFENDGTGRFIETDRFVAGVGNFPERLAFGDLDQDGDLDVLIDRSVLQNDGQGRFRIVGDPLAAATTIDWALGDLDGDGDLDAFRVTFGIQQVWLNDGAGAFSLAATLPGAPGATHVEVADVDGDGDLDALVDERPGDVRIWFNDGQAGFTNRGLRFGGDGLTNFALGDLDGDGDLDAFVVRDGSPDGVWFNVAADELADLSITATSPRTVVREGEHVIYRIVVSNDGALGVTGATVSGTFSHPMTEGIIRSLATGQGAVSNIVPGSITGGFEDTVDLPPGTSITYAVSARVGPYGTADAASTTHFALATRIDLPADVIGDANPSNNWAIDSDCVVAAAERGTGLLSELEPPGAFLPVRDAAVGDLDGDGDLDAFVGIVGADRVLLNDGRGNLSFTDQRLLDETTEIVRLGDLDGDGDLDAIAATRRETGIFWNDGNGVFAEPTEYFSPSSHVTAIALGDLDGDGLLDIFLASEGEAAHRVLLNVGQGTFRPAGQTIFGRNPASAELGDLDQDGDLDLVLAAQQPGQHVIWLNLGDGTFRPSIQAIDQSDRSQTTLGDLDGDGDLDIVVGSYRGTGTQVWLNDGNGEFTPGPPHEGILSRGRLALADFDADGDEDLLVVNRDSDRRPEMWLNDGSGAFERGPEVLVTDSSFMSAAPGDLDGDGDLDALLSTFNGPVALLNHDVDLAISSTSSTSTLAPGGTAEYQITVRNLGPMDVTAARVEDVFSPNLAGLELAAIELSGGAISTLAVGPLDRELRDAVDLPVGASVTYTLLAMAAAEPTTALPTPAYLTSIARVTPPPGIFDGIRSNSKLVESEIVQLVSEQPAGVFVAGPELGADAASRDVALGDVDGDGDLDAVIAISEGGSQLWLNEDGQFTQAGQVLGDRRSFAVALGDVNGDGHLDVVLGNRDEGNQIWLGDGTGRFTDTGQSLEDEPTIDMVLADFDGDGDLDIYEVNYGRGDVLWLNDGQGQFTDSGQRLEYSSNVVSLGDLDGDGDLDVLTVTANPGSGGNSVLFNDGAGNLTRSSDRLVEMSTFGAALGDLDADGDLDAFLANGRREPHRVLFNDGGGNLVDSGQRLGSNEARSVALADMDGDGDLDAFVVEEGRPGRVWLNDGSGFFADSGQSLGGEDQQVQSVALGDLDGDGDLDAVLANREGPDQVWESLDPRTLADLEIQVSSGQVAVQQGGVIEYAITVRNAGPNEVLGATVRDVFAGPLADATLTGLSAVGRPATTLTIGPLDGELADTVDLPVGAALTYHVTVQLPTTGLGPHTSAAAITNTAMVSLPETFAADINPSNNRATDSDVVVLAATASEARFIRSPQTLGEDRFLDVALGDFDGDGDLDAMAVTDRGRPDRVWLNDGRGGFTDSGQRLGMGRSRSVALGDLDGDGDVDAFVASDGPGQVWMNDSRGIFTASDQQLVGMDAHDVKLGDLDGDGDLDAFVVNEFVNQIWLNDGSGHFADSGQLQLHFPDANSVALGDLDSDGDLDAYMTVFRGADRVFLNDGSGVMIETGQSLGVLESTSIALGDLDGDGDLDAFVGVLLQGNRVLLNDGQGTFVEGPRSLRSFLTSDVVLGDLDGDGDLDAYVASSTDLQGRELTVIWLNRGDAHFQPRLPGQNRANSSAVALGDLDGDGDLDVFASALYDSQVVWINRNQTDVAVTIAASADVAAVGEIIELTVTVENLGSRPAFAAILAVPLDPHFLDPALARISTANGAVTPHTIGPLSGETFSDDIDLLPGSTITYVIRATVAEAVAKPDGIGTLHYAAEIHARDGDVDLDELNNTSAGSLVVVRADSPLAGDYNGNFLVEQADLDLVLSNWGKGIVPSGWISNPPSGTIDQSELDAVLSNWGSSASQPAAAAPLVASLDLQQPQLYGFAHTEWIHGSKRATSDWLTEIAAERAKHIHHRHRIAARSEVLNYLFSELGAAR